MECSKLCERIGTPIGVIDVIWFTMDSKNELYRLAREGKLNILKETISKEDLDSKSQLGWTLLTYACMSGHEDVVRYLLEAGADPNLTGDGWVPLHEAANRGFEAIVKLLVSFGADTDVRNDGMSPLHVACVRGYAEVAQVLVEMGADVNAQDEIGLTGLHHAAARGYCDIVRHLVESGADISVEDDVGWIPLDFAIDWGKGEIVKVLLDAGSDPNSVDRDGMMPLHHAANEGAVSVVQVLLEYGADIEATIGDGWTALHEACRRGHLGVMETLLQSGSRPNDATSDGWTALHEACRKNRPDMVYALLEWGACPNVATSEKWTPLLEACAIGNEPTVRLLLESGADPSSFDRRRFTPLYIAEQPPIVSLLLHYRASTDVSTCSHNDTNQFMCCYELSRMKRSHLIATYEQHFIKMESAGFYLSAKAKDPPTLRDWSSSRREEFRLKCLTELGEMRNKQIDGSSATYASVLYQRVSALRQIESLSLDDCQAWFPIYGDLVHSRYVLGRRKLPLLNRSSSFFSFPSLPHLPPECVEEILTYLDEKDLRNIVSLCDGDSLPCLSELSKPNTRL